MWGHDVVFALSTLATDNNSQQKLAACGSERITVFFAKASRHPPVQQGLPRACDGRSGWAEHSPRGKALAYKMCM